MAPKRQRPKKSSTTLNIDGMSARSSLINTAKFKADDINLYASDASSNNTNAQFESSIVNTHNLKAGDINLNVKQPNTVPATSTLQTDNSIEEYYKMGSKHDPILKRGRAVILSYKKFIKKKDNLDGAEYDVGALRSTFAGLNFEVILHEDKTKKKTEEILLYESQFGHSEYDCFVLCILSHGECGRFFCIDNKAIEYEDVFTQFDTCRTLIGKPKLFFIDACQGDQDNNGQKAAGEESTDEEDEEGEEEEDEEDEDDEEECLESGLLLPLPDNMSTNPLKADMLAFFSSYPKFFSLLDEHGSWFTQDLCAVLNQFADKLDLDSIVTKVNQLVSEHELFETTPKRLKRIKQISRCVTTLTKKVKFYP